VPLAHGLHRGEVPPYRRDAAERSADDGLEDDGGDGRWAEALELCLELGDFSGDKGRVGFPGVQALAVGVAGGDAVEAGGDEEGLEGLAAGEVA
jgi:hypothetical protein